MESEYKALSSTGIISSDNYDSKISLEYLHVVQSMKSSLLPLACCPVHEVQSGNVLLMSDSLSSLQVLPNMKYDHRILIKILELQVEIIQEGKEIEWTPAGEADKIEEIRETYLPTLRNTW